MNSPSRRTHGPSQILNTGKGIGAEEIYEAALYASVNNYKGVK